MHRPRSKRACQPKRRATTPSPPGEPRPKAFVIMPYNLLSDQVFANLIKPVLDAAGYSVDRADTSLHQRAIMENVVRGIQDADLVLADLTGRNANVFYELGIAHALRKPVVMIAQSTQDIPFDVTAYPVHIYPLELEKPTRLRDTLTKSLRPVLDGARTGDVIFTNPFTEYGTLGEPAADESSAPEGLLELMARVQKDLPAYTAVLKKATSLMAALGKRQKAINARAGEAPPGGEIQHALMMAAQSGALWDEYSSLFETIVDKTTPLTTSIERGTLATVKLGRLGGNEAEVDSLLVSIGKMAESASESSGMLVEFAQTVRTLSELSGSLRSPGERLASVLESLAAQMGRIGGLASSLGVG